MASRDSVSSQAFSVVCSLLSNMQVAHADKNQMHLFLDHDPLRKCRFIEPKKIGLQGMYQLSWVNFTARDIFSINCVLASKFRVIVIMSEVLLYKNKQLLKTGGN